MFTRRVCKEKMVLNTFLNKMRQCNLFSFSLWIFSPRYWMSQWILFNGMLSGDLWRLHFPSKAQFYPLLLSDKTKLIISRALYVFPFYYLQFQFQFVSLLDFFLFLSIFKKSFSFGHCSALLANCPKEVMPS